MSINQNNWFRYKRSLHRADHYIYRRNTYCEICKRLHTMYPISEDGAVQKAVVNDDTRSYFKVKEWLLSICYKLLSCYQLYGYLLLFQGKGSIERAVLNNDARYYFKVIEVFKEMLSMIRIPVLISMKWNYLN